MDSSNTDQRLPHQLDPPEPVSLEDLKNCGVLYWKVNHRGSYRRVSGTVHEPKKL